MTFFGALKSIVRSKGKSRSSSPVGSKADECALVVLPDGLVELVAAGTLVRDVIVAHSALFLSSSADTFAPFHEELQAGETYSLHHSLPWEDEPIHILPQNLPAKEVPATCSQRSCFEAQELPSPTSSSSSSSFASMLHPALIFDECCHHHPQSIVQCNCSAHPQPLFPRASRVSNLSACQSSPDLLHNLVPDHPSIAPWVTSPGDITWVSTAAEAAFHLPTPPHSAREHLPLPRGSPAVARSQSSLIRHNSLPPAASVEIKMQAKGKSRSGPMALQKHRSPTATTPERSPAPVFFHSPLSGRGSVQVASPPPRDVDVVITRKPVHRRH